MIHWNKAKTRRRSFLKLGLVLAAALAIIVFDRRSGAHGIAPAPLRIVSHFSLPVVEVSGFATERGIDGSFIVSAVGDRDGQLARASVAADGTMSLFGPKLDVGPSILRVTPFCNGVARTPRCQSLVGDFTSQWEAVARDGAGTLFLLQESTGTILVLSSQGDTIVGALGVDLIGTPGALKRRHGDAVQSLGEGLLLLKNGHVLVAKEAGPATLIEFGPPGEKPLGVGPETLLAPGEPFQLPPRGSFGGQSGNLERLATWSAGAAMARCDFSDLAASPSGVVFALSQRCARIVRYSPLAVGEDSATAEEIWALPPKLSHAEALAVYGDGAFLIGLDDSRSDRPNTFLVSAEADSMKPQSETEAVNNSVIVP